MSTTIDREAWIVEPLSPAGGATVAGPRLASLDDAGLDHLADLLYRHHVLVVPGQSDLGPAEHVAFSRHFGEPFIHPHLTAVPGHPAILEVLKTEADADTFGGEYWHADITFRSPPAAVSVLRAIELPAMGGDTLYANQVLAFETLSVGMQDLVRGLFAHHTYPEMTEDEPGASALHPVVRVHPVTGREALFVNPAFVSRLEGMTERESRPLLDALFEHQTRPELQFRVGWEPDQVVLWDNRSVQHYAMNDYPGQRRRLQRVTAMERATPGGN